MSLDFITPRVIADGSQIPALFPYGTVPLLKAAKLGDDTMKTLGASRGKAGWYVKATADLDLELFAPILPRFAQRSIVPELPDLIPASSWHSSLANLMVPSDWQKLAQPYFAHWQGCEECGSGSRMECHEGWDYDEMLGIQRLIKLRSLCRDCHLMQHLGLAGVQNRLDRTMWRLTMINRIDQQYAEDYYEAAMAKWEHRSRMAWRLDLSGLKGVTLRLRSNVQQVADDTLHVDMKHGTKDFVRTRIMGMRIEPDDDGKRLRLVSV